MRLASSGGAVRVWHHLMRCHGALLSLMLRWQLTRVHFLMARLVCAPCAAWHCMRVHVAALLHHLLLLLMKVGIALPLAMSCVWWRPVVPRRSHLNAILTALVLSVHLALRSVVLLSGVALHRGWLAVAGPTNSAPSVSLLAGRPAS